MWWIGVVLVLVGFLLWASWNKAGKVLEELEGRFVYLNGLVGRLKEDFAPIATLPGWQPGAFPGGRTEEMAGRLIGRAAISRATLDELERRSSEMFSLARNLGRWTVAFSLSCYGKKSSQAYARVKVGDSTCQLSSCESWFLKEWPEAALSDLALLGEALRAERDKKPIADFFSREEFANLAARLKKMGASPAWLAGHPLAGDAAEVAARHLEEEEVRSTDPVAYLLRIREFQEAAAKVAERVEDMERKREEWTRIDIGLCPPPMTDILFEPYDDPAYHSQLIDILFSRLRSLLRDAQAPAMDELAALCGSLDRAAKDYLLVCQEISEADSGLLSGQMDDLCNRLAVLRDRIAKLRTTEPVETIGICLDAASACADDACKLFRRAQKKAAKGYSLTALHLLDEASDKVDAGRAALVGTIW